MNFLIHHLVLSPPPTVDLWQRRQDQEESQRGQHHHHYRQITRSDSVPSPEGSGSSRSGGSSEPSPLSFIRRLWTTPLFEDVGIYHPNRRRLQVYMLRLPFSNVFLADGVLIDSGWWWDRKTLHRALARFAEEKGPRDGSPVLVAHAITHAHPDHKGCSSSIVSSYKIPFYCGEGDCASVEGKGRVVVGPWYHPMHWLPHHLWSGRSLSVTKVLKDGCCLGRSGQVHVLETPGHTPGSLSFWLPNQRIAIVGDVLVNQPWLSYGNHSFPACPREAPLRFCHNREESRESLKMIMALGPSMILFGHGPPLVMEEEENKGGRLKAGVAAKLPLLNGNASACDTTTTTR